MGHLGVAVEERQISAVCSSRIYLPCRWLVAIATDTTVVLHGIYVQKSVGANEGQGAAAARRAAGLRAVPPQSLR
jgi:hypothetical protein